MSDSQVATPTGHGPTVPAARLVAGFARVLRGGGLSVPTGNVVMFAEALGHLGVERRDRVYWAGRATLVHQPDDIALYDSMFAAFWLGRVPGLASTSLPQPLIVAADDGDDEQTAGPDAAEGEDEAQAMAVRYSSIETLRHRDFAALDADEWDEARRLIGQLSLVGDLRPSRRRRPARRGGGHPDLRRTIRRSLRHGGVPLERAWKRTIERPRRVVLLVDVSGSMEPYARALLRFAHAAVSSRGAGRVEAFTLGTRLTRLTRELSQRDPDAALTLATRAVPDWSGGTRLGDGLQEFNDRWGVGGLARGAVVIVLSDGWDRGDPATLGAQMARLARVAHRTVWVNPLKSTAGYAPLARGMAAALPYVDQFVEGHSVDSLERLAEVVSGGPTPGLRRRLQ